MSRLFFALVTTCWALSGGQAVSPEEEANAVFQEPLRWEQTVHSQPLNEDFYKVKEIIMNHLRIGTIKLTQILHSSDVLFSDSAVQKAVSLHQDALFYGVQATWFFNKWQGGWSPEADELAFKGLKDCLNKSYNALRVGGASWDLREVSASSSLFKTEEPIKKDLKAYLTNFGSHFATTRSAIQALEEAPEFEKRRPEGGRAFTFQEILEGVTYLSNPAPYFRG